MSILLRLVRIAATIASEVIKSAEEDKRHRLAGTGRYSPEAIAAAHLEKERHLETEKALAEKAEAEKALWTWHSTPRPIDKREADEKRVANLEARATELSRYWSKRWLKEPSTKVDEMVMQAATLYGAACELREGIGEDVEHQNFPYGENRKYSRALSMIQNHLGEDAYYSAFKHGTLYMHEENYNKLRFNPAIEVEVDGVTAEDTLWEVDKN